MNQQIKVHSALLLVAILYGANYSMAKEVMPQYVQPFGLILMRVTGAILFFVPFLLLKIKERIRGAADWKRIILCSIFGITINQLAFFGGLSMTSPINASLISTFSPIVVLIMSSILLKEKIKVNRMVGIALAGVGAYLLISSRAVGKSHGNPIGDLLVLLNATSFGIYLVLVKPLMQKYNAITVMTYIFSIGLIGVLPFGVPPLLSADYAHFPLKVWLVIAFTIIGVTIMVYLLNAWAMKYASPSLVGVYIYLQPVIAILIAVALGKDVFTLEKALFAGLILAGVFLVSRPKKTVPSPRQI